MDQANKDKNIQFRDKYVITEDDYYGEGCFGQVYTCKLINDSDDTLYCVKAIPINVNQDLNNENETIINNTIAQLNSNQLKSINLVQISDIYFDSSVLFIVMERCDEDLSIEFNKLKEENTWYTEEEVFDLIQQLISGLKQLNSSVIMHQNLKPENILIKYENKGQTNERKIYKIADYEISILISKLSQKQDLIRTGSPNYTAPQVFEDDVIQSEKSDIFSFGILIYQICYKAQFPYDCSSINKRYQSLQYLKNNSFKAPPLNYSRGEQLQNLLESMIVYNEKQRISFADLFTHIVVKSKGLDDTVVMNSEYIYSQSRNFGSSKLFDKSIHLEKKKKTSILLLLQKLQLLLESFLDKFKICQQLIEQIEDNNEFLFFKLNIYLIGNYQLLYALALIYIRPFELHPSILKYNDQLMLIEKLNEAQKGIKIYHPDTLIYKNLQDSIQLQYHQFANQFKRFYIDIKKRKDLSKELKQFMKQAVSRRIELIILQENINNFQQTYLNKIPKNLQQLLEQVVKFGSLSPISHYQKGIDQQYQTSVQIGQI
ncbi:unnamed protein product [Paramecium primaurelia]|uniref:Protein kinase domain-containing protein n=1 Tax=Paramecium primaurelia TaxID=5886 RepID=A0A8S1P9Q2_PARPR|nr:unnamed protein product [Paramecium primaurelia]